MQIRRSDIFTTIRTEGAILPADLLQRIAEGDRRLEGLTPEDYHLAGNEKLNEAANRSWNRLLGAWLAFKDAAQKLRPDDPGTSVTRERWLLILFQELGYGRLQSARAVEIDGKSYPISHFWNHVPIHLVGLGTPMDRRTAGVAGAARTSPHSLVQEYLNRSDASLWGMVSNGLKLRILRDNVSLTRQAYVEFDLEAMMNGEVYSDFALLWLLCHQSRVEGEKPESCRLEKWSRFAQDQGTRALDQLRDGVAQAIEALGRGFLHKGNTALRDRLHTGALDKQDYYRELLRLVYRLLFLFVAEDRNLLCHPDAGMLARERYVRFYSTARLRRLAEKRRGSRHTDLFEALRVVMSKLGEDEGCPELGLPALGSFLFSAQAISNIESSIISNDDFLDAIRALAITSEGKVIRLVDYKNLGAEELGSVYESLLELHPELNLDAGTFSLTTAGGHERKTTGSYYTPTSLITCLLDSALDPVVDEACKKPDPEKALLSLKICDPACGSGHFLIAAAHRVAKRLAAVRTGDDEPAPESVRTALRDVIGHCIYGVDINEMAVELCKVALWMEALEPGKPLSFLDHRVRCGNSLLGTTPALLAAGIPDEAFAPIEGDDKAFASSLKRRNREERAGQMALPLVAEPVAVYGGLSEEITSLDKVEDSSIAGIHEKQGRYRRLSESPEYRRAQLASDAWCAAFVWKKTKSAPEAVTQDVLRRLMSDPERVPRETRAEIARLAAHYNFFHWHLAFPDVFRIPPDGRLPENLQTGWDGGFDVVLGNPPWEAEELVEKEFFAASAPEIASVRTKAKRAELIAGLRETYPQLYDSWKEAQRTFGGRIQFCRYSGRFPLGASGKLNTYRLFAELASQLIATRGRFGQVLKSGIVSAQNSQELFSCWVEACQVVEVREFINTNLIFPAVVPNERFCLLTLTGRDRPCRSASYAFTLKTVGESKEANRSFRTTSDELAILNPADRSVPPASSRRDYQLLLRIHNAAEALRVDAMDLNPWGVHYSQGHLNSASDSALFADLTFEQLSGQGASLEDRGWFRLEKQTYLPLYEGKYIAQANHRFSTFEGVPADRRFGVKAEAINSTCEQLGDPGYEIRPRYWLAASDAESIYAIKETHFDWLFGFRDVCRSIVDARTVQACVMPRLPCLDGIPLLVFESNRESAAFSALLLNALWISFVFDYAARQKIHGAHLTKAIAYQLPIPCKDSFQRVFTGESYELFIRPRSLELTVVSSSLLSFGRDCGYFGLPFRWDEERRLLIRCELDAAFFHLYGMDREDAGYIMDSFPIVRRKEEARLGEYRTKRVILEIYDAMSTAIRTGHPYQTRLDPPPGPPEGGLPDWRPDSAIPATWPRNIHYPKDSQSSIQRKGARK